MATPLTSTHPRGSVGSNPFAPRMYGELHRVTDCVYIYRNITNSSFVIGDHGVAVIDTQVNFPTAENVLKAIRSVTDKPILYAINTHYHWDHTNGNALFKKEGAQIVSSKLTQEFMTVRAPRQKEFLSGRGFELGKDPLLPEKTFEGEMELDLGSMPLRLFFAGKAETDDATAVYLPSERIVMAGDTVMTGSFPIFGQPVWDEGLQDAQWIQTIETLMKLKPDCIIPGHGPLAYQKEIDLLVRIQKYFLEEVQILVNQGKSLEQILVTLEARLPDWIKNIPLVWGTPRYAILRVWRGLTRKPEDKEVGWQQFKPSAIAHEAGEGGDMAMKLSILKKATEISPNSPQAYAEYADALIEGSRTQASVLEKGDFFNAARKAWEKALTINPHHAPSLLGKGRYLTMMAYRGGEDPAEGMTLLREALSYANEPKMKAECEFYIGMGYRRLFDEVSAKQQFSKALAFDAGFMPAILALQA